ncbi:MAG: hypothetical protein HYY39_08880 [Armatimonadetes bacterium]|nr:hypothetical protein [Armatimonadota bacterium]
MRTLTRRHVGWGGAAGVVLLLLLIGIAWKATSVLWFLLFPLLLVGLVAAAAMAVLWGLRHF